MEDDIQLNVEDQLLNNSLPMSQQTHGLEFTTKIDFLKTRFYFHDCFKTSTIAKHYIVEDLEYDNEYEEDEETHIFYYLKQSIYKDENQFKEALLYFQSIYNYCQSRFAKSDIVGLNYLFEFENANEGYFEIVTCWDYGETDRIDVEKIESHHITKFLKNVCVLLNDLKKFQKVAHKNLDIKNIILVNNELKISGFKPNFYKSLKGDVIWKQVFLEKYGEFRLDLYLLGILWLKFLNVKFGDKLASNLPYEEVLKNVTDIQKKLPKEKKMAIVLKLLDIKKNKDLTLEKVILEFNEYYLLKKLKDIEEVEDNQSVQMGEHELHPQKETIFTKAYRPSSTNLEAISKSGKEPNTDLKNIIQIVNNNFTLKENSIKNKFNEKDELIHIDSQKGSTSDLKQVDVIQRKSGIEFKQKVINDRKSVDPNLLKMEGERQKISRNVNRSVKKLDTVAENSENPFIKIKQVINEEKERRKSMANDIMKQNFKKKEDVEVIEEKNDGKKKGNKIGKKDGKKKKGDKKNLKKKKLGKKDKNGKESKKKVGKKKNKKKINKPEDVQEDNEKINDLNFDQFTLGGDFFQNENKDKVNDDNEVFLTDKNLNNENNEAEIELNNEDKNDNKKNIEENENNEDNNNEDDKNDGENNEDEKEENNEENNNEEEKNNGVENNNEDNNNDKDQNSDKDENNEKDEKNESDDNENKKEKIQRNLKNKKEPTKPLKKFELSRFKSPSNLLNQIMIEKAKLDSKKKSKNQKSKKVPKKKKTKRSEPPKKVNLNYYNTMKKNIIYPPVKLNTIVPKNNLKKSKALNKNLALTYNLENEKKSSVYKNILKGQTLNLDEIEFIDKPDLIPNRKERDKGLDLSIFEKDDVLKINELNSKKNIFHISEKDFVKPMADFKIKNEFVNKNPLENRFVNLEEMDESPIFETKFKLKNKNLENPFIKNLENSQSEINSEISDEEKEENDLTVSIDLKNDKIEDEIIDPKESKNNEIPFDLDISNNEVQIKSNNQFNPRDNKTIINIVDDLEKPNLNLENKNILKDINNKVENSEILNTEYEYYENMIKLKKLLEEEKIEEALKLSEKTLKTQKGQKKINLYKSTSIIHYKLKNYQDSIKTLKEGLTYLNTLNPNLRDQNKRTLLINLALAKMELKKDKEALKILKNKLFENPKNRPIAYLTILGDCLHNLNQNLSAFEAYNEHLYNLNKNILNKDLMENMVLHIKKIVNVLIDNKNDKIFCDFFKYVIDMLDRLTLADDAYRGRVNCGEIREKVLIEFFDVLNKRKNDNLLNYCVNYVVDHGLLRNEYLDSKDKNKIVQILLGFSMHLKKLPNYGNQRESFELILEKILELLEILPQSFENLKKKLLVLFNQGILAIQKKDYQTSKNKFDSCLEIYENNYENPDEELFVILYNIGLTIYNSGKYKDCVYFFEKINSLDCKDFFISNKTTKMLSKVYYRLGEIEKCFNVLKDWIFENVGDSDHSQSKNFYRYLSIFFVCCLRLNSEKFLDVIFEMKKKISSEKNFEMMHYLYLFYNLSEIYFKRKHLKDNLDYIEKFMKLIDNKDKSKFASKFLNIMNSIYNKIVLHGGLKKKNLLECMRDDYFNNEENSLKIENFLYNFFFVFLNGISIVTDSDYSYKFRKNILDNIEFIKDKNKVFDKIHDFLKKNPFKKGHHEHNLKNFQMKIEGKDLSKKEDTLNKSHITSKSLKSNKSNISKKTYLTKRSNNSKISKFTNFSTLSKMKMRRINSSKFGEVFQPKETRCTCNDFINSNKDLCKIIDEFFRELKNMLYLKTFDDFPLYLDQLERVLKNKNLRILKFRYIIKLFSFHEVNKNNERFNNKKFSIIIESIISTGLMCIHDYKKIMMILEFFLNEEYIENFVRHLDKYHKHISKVVFETAFLENFLNKNIKMTKHFFNLIQKQNRNFICNNIFYDLFNSEELEERLKVNTSFNYFERLRYKILNEKRMKNIFKRYFKKDEILDFKLKYNSYKAIIDLTKNKKDSLEVLKNFGDKFFEIILVNDDLKIDYKNYLYDFFLIVYFVDFKSENSIKIAEKILQILFFIEERQEADCFYHLSLICSKIGNIVFNHRLWDICIKFKTVSFESLKKMKETKIDFPGYINEMIPKELLFDIFSYMFFCELEKEENEKAFKCLEKIQSLNFENQNLNEMLKFYELYYFVKIGKKYKVRTLLKKFKIKNMDKKSIEFNYLSIVEELIIDAAENNLIFEDNQNWKKLISGLSRFDIKI